MNNRKKRVWRPMCRPMFPLYWGVPQKKHKSKRTNESNDSDSEKVHESSQCENVSFSDKEPKKELPQNNGEKKVDKNKTDDGGKKKINSTTFDEAVKLHNLGVEGDKEAVSKALALFEKLHQEDPDNHLVEAYYGSATTLLGRDGIDPTERFKNALKGNKILDRAVASDPNNHRIRILRGYVSYRLPEMYFHRTAKAVEDFSYLVSQYESNNSAFSREFYWQLLFDLGVAYKNLGQNQEAESIWMKLLSLTTDPKYRELVKQEGIQLPEVSADSETVASLSDPGTVMEAKEELPDKELPKEGIRLHRLALNGDLKAAQEAFALFEKAHKKEPHNPLVMAYYADSLSMMGRDSKNPTDMFANAIKAMKILDKAVNARPDDINIRLLRANHGYRLPEPFFRRSTTAVTDFEYLVERYRQDDSIFPPETFHEILFKLGKSYKRLEMEEEATSTWQKLMSLDKDEKYRAMIVTEQEEGEDIDLEGISMQNKDRLVKEAIRLHDLGVAGNKKAVKTAHHLLQKAHEADPDDPLVMGYYGSCIALTGRDSNDPSEMFGNGIKGFVMLKKAIAKDWSNPHLRVLRGYLAYNLPDAFFPMTERAVKDLRHVKSACEQDSGLFSEEFYWQILYDLGTAYRRLGDEGRARKVWTKLLKVTSDPKYQELVNIEQL